MADEREKEVDPNWSKEAKQAFNDFKKRKRPLPSPSDSNHTLNSFKKIKNFNLSSRFNTQSISRRDLFDKNRISNDLFNVSNNGSFVNELHMSIDGYDSEMDRTEVVCDNFEKNIAKAREMIKNKADSHDILEKLTDNMAEFYKHTCEMMHKMNTDNALKISQLNYQIVSLENNLHDKLNFINERTDDKLNAIEVSQKCAKESCILWISFTDPKEIELLRLKNKSDLIKETKQIFARMNIWMNSMNRQIFDVFIQKVSVRSEKGFGNELLLGIKFISSITVQELKRLVMDFAKRQFMAKKYDDVRYTVRENWSPTLWKLLRVCYDLSSFGLIDNAHVCETGIQVYVTLHDISNDGEKKSIQTKLIVKTESDLDSLRAKIGDVGSEFSTFRVYDGNYFKLNVKERIMYKEKFKKKLATEEHSSSLVNGEADINGHSQKINDHSQKTFTENAAAVIEASSSK